MSQGTVMIQAQNRLQEKDFTVATPEEFVHRFGGTRVINKVNIRGGQIAVFIKDIYFYNHDLTLSGADRQQWYRGS